MSQQLTMVSATRPARPVPALLAGAHRSRFLLAPPPPPALLPGRPSPQPQRETATSPGNPRSPAFSGRCVPAPEPVPSRRRRRRRLGGARRSVAPALSEPPPDLDEEEPRAGAIFNLSPAHFLPRHLLPVTSRGPPPLIRLPTYPLPPGPDSLRLGSGRGPRRAGAGARVGWRGRRRPRGTDLQVQGPGSELLPSPHLLPFALRKSLLSPSARLTQPWGPPEAGKGTGLALHCPAPGAESPTLGSEPRLRDGVLGTEGRGAGRLPPGFHALPAPSRRPPPPPRLPRLSPDG